MSPGVETQVEHHGGVGVLLNSKRTEFISSTSNLPSSAYNKTATMSVIEPRNNNKFIFHLRHRHGEELVPGKTENVSLS